MTATKLQLFAWPSLNDLYRFYIPNVFLEEEVDILCLLVEIRDGDEGEVKYCHHHYSNTSLGPSL